MDENTQFTEIDWHFREVGLICAHWAYLEWLLEITLWWLLGLPLDGKDGRVITGSLPIHALARRAAELAHRKLG